MRKIFFILFLFISYVSSGQNCSQIRRVCRIGNDNELFWNTPGVLPCGTFKEYRIFARDKTTDPFVQLRMEPNIGTLFYNHSNANVPNNKNWEYFIQIVSDCGGVENYCYTDTQNISVFKLPKSNIAFVSVNPITNEPIIYWEKNSYPSFWYMDLYNDTLIKNAILDTFFVDNVSRGNPQQQSLKYVIAAVDSCTNRWSYDIADYHKTIHLQSQIDTCKNIITLNWSKYVGWNNNIDKHYIYKKVNNTSFILIDSVNGTSLGYTDKLISLNNTYTYYVTAVNSINNIYKSNSNTITKVSGIRDNTTAIVISAISLESGNIELIVNKSNTSDIDTLIIQKSFDNTSFFNFKALKNQTSPFIFKDLNETGDKRVFYKVINKTTCAEYKDTTVASTNIVVQGSQEASKNLISWNHYFTWNSGIDKYTLLRETRVNNLIINPFSQIAQTLDSFYNDDLGSSFTVGNSYCYMVIGQEKNTGYKSKSNEVCLIGGLIVYFPDGIISSTENRVFKPIGVYIDYSKSNMIIYNRWGSAIKSISDLNQGWDLTDENNNFVAADTYVYEAQIVGLDGKQLRKSGTITVLR